MLNRIGWVTGVCLSACLAIPAGAAQPPYLGIDCPATLRGVYLEPVDPSGFDPPSGWSAGSGHTYASATLPGVDASVHGGWLSCGYGVPRVNPEGGIALGGFRTAQIRRAQPSSYACYPVEEIGYYGFDCYLWLP